MKFSYDPEADALNIRLSNASFADTIEVAPGVLVDVDENGDVISIEMLDVRKRTYLEVQLPNMPASYLHSSGYEQVAPSVGKHEVAVGVAQETVTTAGKHYIKNNGHTTGYVVCDTDMDDTRGVLEKTADTLTGNRVDEKFGRPV